MKYIGTLNTVDNFPLCHICGSDDCYEMVMVTTDGKEQVVKKWCHEEDGYLCIKCHNWMTNSGRWVTKFLHFLLKIRYAMRYHEPADK